MSDGNRADSRVSTGTRWTAGPANTSRMWNPGSWRVAGQGQQASAHEVTSPPSSSSPPSLWPDWENLAMSLWLQVVPVWKRMCAGIFPPCWYFMIKLDWSPEVHAADFPLKTTNLFSERFLLCLWNCQCPGVHWKGQHQVIVPFKICLCKDCWCFYKWTMTSKPQASGYLFISIPIFFLCSEVFAHTPHF